MEQQSSSIRPARVLANFKRAPFVYISKHCRSSIWPARVLVNLKSTLASRAGGAVDEAVRSVVTPDVLESIDSAVGEVFFSTVCTRVYIPTLSAIQAIWRGRNYRDGAN